MPSSGKTNICLCGPSALSAWRHFDNRIADVPLFGHTPHAGPVLPEAFPSKTLRSAKDLSEFGLGMALLRAHGLDRWGLDCDAMHLLVDRGGRSSGSEGVLVHTSKTELPKKAFLRLDEGVYAASPEYCFATASKHRGFVEHVLLGFELTGCYAVRPDLKAGIFQRPPLCSKDAIGRLLEKMGSYGGRAQAEKALSYVVDGSGSPRETALTLILCLPMRYGGFGLPWPKLNYRVDLRQDGSILWGRKNAFDMVWEQHGLIIEYDGRDSHEGEAASERDSLRYDAAVAAGNTVLCVTRSQLAAKEQTYAIARVVAKRLGVRLRFRGGDFSDRHQQLRSIVLGRHL